MFVIGTRVKGGLYGTDPVLGSLDGNGDLIYGIDFRSAYATVLNRWMGDNAAPVLNGTFEDVGFL
jgi:uncharacterized protein (DUF1501 family)